MYLPRPRELVREQLAIVVHWGNVKKALLNSRVEAHFASGKALRFIGI
jgi:hypothetical protein